MLCVRQTVAVQDVLSVQLRRLDYVRRHLDLFRNCVADGYAPTEWISVDFSVELFVAASSRDGR